MQCVRRPGPTAASAAGRSGPQRSKARTRPIRRFRAFFYKPLPESQKKRQPHSPPRNPEPGDMRKKISLLRLTEPGDMAGESQTSTTTKASCAFRRAILGEEKRHDALTEPGDMAGESQTSTTTKASCAFRRAILGEEKRHDALTEPRNMAGESQTSTTPIRRKAPGYDPSKAEHKMFSGPLPSAGT